MHPSSQQTTDSLSKKTGPQTYSIEINKMKFEPQELEVHKGDTVVWNNQDYVARCITEDPRKAWTSSQLQPGNSWKMAITKSCNYYCAIHEVMKGKIVVKN